MIPIYAILEKKQNYGDNKRISGCWGWGRGEQGNTDDLQGSENTLYDTVMMDTCHYTLVQTRGMHSTESEPYVKYGPLGNYDVLLQVPQLCHVDHSGGECG